MVHIVRVGSLLDPALFYLTTSSGAPADCDTGTWDFTQDCQSAHIFTAGW